MGCGVRTQLGLIQGLPLTARAQDIEDGIGTVAIGHPWASSRHPRWVFTCTGSSGCNTAHNSSEMRNPSWCDCWGFALVLVSWLLVCSYLQFTTLPGYSDRHLVNRLAPRCGSCPGRAEAGPYALRCIGSQCRMSLSMRFSSSYRRRVVQR